jgi:asparagine synthase (glutamine-hydrolysing)
MCGIAGKVALDPRARVDEALLRRMTRAIAHRGPDDEGVWVDGAIGLGARRLAVIDLSPRGHQPMANEDESIHLTFNGEIYNFRELRHDLERRGHRFQSHTDTETIVHLYEEEGVACLSKLRGMFAFALWDAPRRTLLLARDRLGKKPLVYYHDSRQFVFGSEPKVILQDEAVPAEADPESIYHYLTFGDVPASRSAFRGFHKLPPAHYLLLEDGRVTLHRYWALSYQPQRAASEGELVEELSARVEEAVRIRLVSDRPLGALLSGGLDSSAVVAMMRRLTNGPVRTFSIGFDEPEYDELPYARQVAQRFDTEHHELVVRPDALAILPRLVWHYDEPLADSSAVPSFAVCELARQSVTVALNGDGGDESFLGYQRYLAMAIGARVDRLPSPVRRALTWGASLLPGAGPRSFGTRVRRFAAELPLQPRERYLRWLTIDDGWKSSVCAPAFLDAMQAVSSQHLLDGAFEQSNAPTPPETAAHSDVQLYLPDDLLVKMDVASMAHSLEVRSPFLDHTLVEFAARLPLGFKIRGRTQKYLVKRLMKGRLPADILRRPKRGFAVPIDRWFRREIKDLAYDVLLGASASGRGYFRLETVRRYLDDHVRGAADHQHRLWALLMLELWHRAFIDRRADAHAPAVL